MRYFSKCIWLLCFSFLMGNAFSAYAQNKNDIDYSKSSRAVVETAAHAGDPSAQYYEWAFRLFWGRPEGNVGADVNLVQTEEEAKKNRKISLPWFEKASAQGQAEATNMLATLVTTFANDEPDWGAARGYWERSISQGSTVAKVNYGANFIDDTKYGQQAFKYLQEAEVELGEGVSEYSTLNYTLLRVYSFGLVGQEYDPKKSFGYGEKCAYGEGAIADCQYLFARYLQSGWAGRKDINEAFKLFKVAAEQDHPRSQWYLGMAYLNGEGVEPSETKAFGWVEKSALGGDPQGMTSYAVMNALGQGTVVDYDKAFLWYEKLAHTGSHHALRSLGAMLITGEGRDVDLGRGYAALIVASEGDEISTSLLNHFIENYESRKVEIHSEYADLIAEVRLKYGFGT